VIGLAAERSVVAAVFGSRIPRWLRNISFSIDLYEIPLLPLTPLVTQAGVADPWLVGNLATMAAVIGVSVASFRWLENHPNGRCGH
jgi:peptidoglycan/LPS O-acetylase OafA/YrhL